MIVWIRLLCSNPLLFIEFVDSFIYKFSSSIRSDTCDLCPMLRLDQSDEVFKKFRYKVLSSWKFVMSEFERVSQSSGLVMPRRPTEEDVKRLYEPIALYIQNICSATTRKRTCRPSQLRLVSLVRVMRADLNCWEITTVLTNQIQLDSCRANSDYNT